VDLDQSEIGWFYRLTIFSPRATSTGYGKYSGIKIMKVSEFLRREGERQNAGLGNPGGAQ
jgi:hypothetical protein